MQHLWKTLIGTMALSAAAIGMTAMASPASAADIVSQADATVAVATGTTELEPVETTGWQTLSDGSICYLDESGSRLTGIQTIDEIPYLFSPDGVLRTGWQTIDGKRYYYEPENGTAQFGWMDFSGNRYYITEDAGKQTGWMTLDGITYYFDADGALQTGFFKTDDESGLYYADALGAVCQDGIYTIDDTPYWFYADGTLHTGWQTIDGIRRYYSPVNGVVEYGWVIWNDQYYYVTQEDGKYKGLQQIDEEYYPFSEADGAIAEGFCTLPDGTVRYYYGNGTYQKGWLKTEDGTYYFSTDGTMQVGWQSIGNDVYYFSAQGAMAVGFTKIDDATFYFDANGRQQFGLQKIQNKWYCFNSDSGAMEYGWIALSNGKYFFQNDGTAATGWQNIENHRYYFDGNGIMYTGWRTIGGKRYCFDGNGIMVTGWQTASDGKNYYFDANGVMCTGWNTISGNTYYFSENGANVRGIAVIGNARYYFLPSSGILLRGQTQNGITTDGNGVIIRFILDTPYLSQSGFPTGCESASAVMLLQDAGYNISIETFVQRYLDLGSLYYENGVLYGPDPNKAFIGDPHSSHGYGCYAPVIATALNRAIGSGDVAVNITGSSMSSLLTNYIDKGTPVAIWATINMMLPESGTQWIVPETGGLFTWTKHEHCLVLVGYDSQYYYMNDPYNSNGLRAYSRSVVDARYAALGYQAVVIQKK